MSCEENSILPFTGPVVASFARLPPVGQVRAVHAAHPVEAVGEGPGQVQPHLLVQGEVDDRVDHVANFF